MRFGSVTSLPSTLGITLSFKTWTRDSATRALASSRPLTTQEFCNSVARFTSRLFLESTPFAPLANTPRAGLFPFALESVSGFQAGSPTMKFPRLISRAPSGILAAVWRLAYHASKLPPYFLWIERSSFILVPSPLRRSLPLPGPLRRSRRHPR